MNPKYIGLYNKLTELGLDGSKYTPEEFAKKMESPEYAAKIKPYADRAKLDWNYYTTPKQEGGIVSDFLYETYDEAVKKPVAEKVAQKPVRDMQGYEQKGLGVPQKELRPKTGDFDINAQPIFKDNVPSVYQNTLSFERPQDAMGDFFSDGREESDPIKAGIQKYAELKKSESPIKQLESIVEATRPKIDPNNPLQVHTARYQKAINRDKAAITNIVNTTVNPISQTEEGGIMDYILPKSDLSQLSSAAEALILNKSAEAIQQRLDKGEILSRTQSEALKIAQKRAGSPDASPKELARIMQAIEENDDKTLLNYVAPLDREFAKTAYNNIDKDRTAAAYKKRPNELTSKERLGFWFGTTKYNQQRKDKDDPAYLPYTMLAHDDQNISQQIERLKTLFPDQEGGVMSLEPPKGLAAEFPKPAERAYAYYQILANRYTQLTKELQNESISMDKEDKANLLDERLKANSMLQGAAIFLPIVGVQDVTNPKVKEWYSVLNKINALAPMIRNAKVGAAENEAQDYTLGRFTNTTAEAALDIYGAPYEKTDRARIAGEQSEVINDAEINTKTGMNPESIAILKERSKSGDIDDLATWGNTAGGFAGIMMPFMAAGMVGGNKLQSTTQGLSRLDKGSQIGRVLLNAEGGLTKTGWLAQKAINLGMTGLQYEYAGAISGEGKDLRNELRFSQGVLGYAGSQALTGSLGLLMKGGMKLGGKFVSKIPYFEKGIKAIEEAYGSKYANYAKAYLANGFSELGEEIPQDWRNNLEEVKGDDIFQKMLAAAQKTADDIAYDDIEGKYSMSKALGYALPIIAMGGKYDGIGVEDVHKISDWAVTFGEQITGEKTSEEDKQTIREFSDFIAEQAGQSPANVRFTDKGTLFTLDGKEYLYNAETQSVTSKQGVTEPEKQNAVAVAQEMMANYNKAIKEGDFTGLFGENVRPYNKQNEETAIPQHQEVSAQEIVQETPLQDPLLQIPEIPQELTFPAETNTQTESIQNKSQKVQQEIKNKSLFSIGGTFSSELGGSNQESVPTERRVVNGIEFVQFSNPTTGIADVIMTGTSGRDFVGYYRIYDENGKPTNRWSSKLENQSRNKENIKTMFEVTQQMLPNGHEYTEATSISTDGLRVWQQSLNRGYELQRDDNGGIITNRVAINGDAIENVLGIEVNRGDFDNISVSSSKQFNSVKRALLPFLEKIGMGENNIYWENGTVYIDLPVLKKAEQVAQEVPIIESAEAIQEAPEVEAAEIEQPPQKTAEELDVRRGEIESRLPQIEAELEALRNKPLLESTEEDADMEDFLLAEQADLQNEFEDIAETRKTVRTAKETEVEQEAQRVEALTQKTQRVADIKGEIAQIEGASKALPIRERLSAKANIEALNAEKEALSTEIEALQPKKETPVIQESRIVETPIAETPIIAETPQLETPIVESKKKEPEPIQKEAVVEKLPEVGGVEEGGVEKGSTILRDAIKKEQDIYGVKESRGGLQDREDAKVTIKERSSIFDVVSKEKLAKDLGLPVTYFDDISFKEWAKINPSNVDGMNRDTYKGYIEKLKENYKDDISAYAETKAEKQESNSPEIEVIKPENKQPEKVAETPVAPAAPKEQKPQPEKGESKRKPKTEPPKPPATPKEPTTIKPVKSGSELAEMLGNTEQAIETGKLWDRVAKMWAKKTGKTIEDWWDRIESIQVGGEGQKGSVKFENGKFIVFLASDRDVSTPVHELAHIFQTDLSESEKKSVVNWYNEKNGTNHKVTDWGFAENETSRNISEYFAEGFVEWLKEGGKTTDKAMRSVFEKFKGWLKDVVNTVFDAKVELNEDMRAIYEQIFTEKEKEEIEKEGDLGIDISDAAIQKEFGKSALDSIIGDEKHRKQYELPDLNRGRVIAMARNILKIDKDEFYGKEADIAIAEALQYEGLLDDNFQDLSDRIQKGGTEINRSSVERMIEVGVELPKNIVNAFNRNDLLGDKKQDFMNPVQPTFDEKGRVANAANKYGWTSESIGGGYVLSNRLGKPVLKVTEKNSKYVITDTQGKKILQGNKDIGEGVEKTIRDFYYGQTQVDVIQKALDKGKYQAAITQGRMTAQDAAEIIKSAGLEVPSDITNNTLYQTDPYHKSLEDWVISEVTADELAQDPKEARDFVFEYIEPYVGKDVANEIIDRAFERILNPPKEIKADAAAELEIDNKAREIVAKLNEDFSQENADKASEKIDELLDNSLLSESQKEAVRDRNKIRERAFGAKFRDNYSIALGDAVRENILAKTYFYDKLKNDIALAQSKAQMELFLNDAIEQVADEWYNEGKLTEKNQKSVADSEAFYAAVLEKLIDITLNDLAKVSDINTYWQKTGTTMYAVKLASEVSKQLNEKNTAESKAQAKSLAEKVGIAINSLAEVGTGGGRLINMFSLFANMNGALAKDYMATMMEGIYGEITAKKKEIKDVIETFISTTEDIVQDMASGKDGGLLDRIMEAVAKNPKVEALIDSILNRANTLEDLQDQIDISEEAEVLAIALKDTINELNEANKELVEVNRKLNNKSAALRNAKKRVAELNERIRILGVQIAKNGANIESLKKQLDKVKSELSSAETQLNAAENENKQVIRTNDALRKQIEGLKETIKNLKEERAQNSGKKAGTNEAKAEKAAKQKAKRSKGQTDVSNALSKLLNYKGDNTLYQRTKINSQAIAGIYPAEVIRDVNNAIKTMADFFYEDTKTHTNSTQFYDDFIVYAKAELAKLPINATLAADIVTNLDNRDFATTVEPYIQERINKDYTNNVRKRVIGLNATISDPLLKRKEIRQVLGDLVMKAATATEEEKVNIEGLIKDVFGITDAQNIADFTAEFNTQFRELVADKQKQLIAKRLLTDAERKGKTDAEVGKALLDKLAKQGHHKFLDNFAKDVRITTPNWSNDTAKRLSETYEVAINSPAQLQRIDDLLKIADKMPDGILKEKAMHNVMIQFVRMVNFSNARKWRATANEMKHFNRLSGSTHLQNIGDTVNKLISLFWGTIIPERLVLGLIGQTGILGNTKLGKNAKDTYIRQATAFVTMLYDARRVAWNRFNLAEARYQHEFENVIDFYEKNFAELDPDLRNISWNRPLRAFFQRMYLGGVKLWGGKSVAVGNKATMEAFDVWGQYILNMQEQASMLNRMNVSESDIFEDLNIDRTNIPQMQSIIDNEIAQGFYTKGSKIEFVRRQELLADYLQDKYGTSELGKRYGLGMTYKLVPAGDFAGLIYAAIQATVNKLKQFENVALNHYERKGGTALGTIYHATSVVTKLINAFDYSKTMLNVANWLIDWDLTIATLRLAKNNAISDVLFGADVQTWEKHHNMVYDSKTKKERVSSTEFQNIAAQVHEIDKGIEEIDRQINQYTNDADTKRQRENDRAAAKIASINKRNIDPAEKARLIAKVDAEKTATLANIDNVEARAKKPLQDTKAQLNKNRTATVAAYESALSRKRGQIARDVIIYAIGIASIILNAQGDDDDEPFVDIIGSSPEGKIPLAKQLNIEESAARNRFVLRYGKLLGTKDVYSYGFTDTPMLIPFSIFGGINDQIRRVKYGKDGGEMAWTNSITQSALDISHQILSFRGLEMLSDAANPKTDNMTALTKLWQALSPYGVPAVIKQPLSDIQGAKTYKADKNAEGYVAAEFMRTFGLDRGIINTIIGTDVFAQQYSPLDGRPIRSWTNKDKLELGRFVFDAFHEGKEKSIKSLNQTRYQKDDFVQYLVYKGWLHKTGIAEKVGLTTIDNSIPVMEKGKVVGMIAIPEADFQKFIVKPAGKDFERAMIRMYKTKEYVLGFSPSPEGELISSSLESATPKTAEELIEKAKKGDFDKPNQEVLISAMAAKSDLTAFNLAVQEVAANLMEAQKAKYADEYLKLRPQYKQLKEKFPAYKERAEEMPNNFTVK